MDERPIGIFDSGVGGLTVLKEIRQLLPQEDLIYFGDTARVPYGGKSIPIIRQFSLEITRFLESMKVKLIVVACNTASALTLDFLRRQTTIPMIGVIEPGVRAAIENPEFRKIGVIGTVATIRSEAYQNRIKRLRGGCEVFSKPCPLLVPLVEENLLKSNISRMALEMYLSEFKKLSLDALILACTHYPLLKPLIGEFLGPRVHLIDSAAETAKEVGEVLKARRLKAPRIKAGSEEFYVSDSPENFSTIGGYFLERPLSKVFLEPVWQRDFAPAS